MPRGGRCCQRVSIGQSVPLVRWPSSQTITSRPSDRRLSCGATQQAWCSQTFRREMERCSDHVRPPSRERAAMMCV